MIELRRYFSFIFLTLPKIWVGRTTLKGEKKGDVLKIMSGVFSDNFVLESV